MGFCIVVYNSILKVIDVIEYLKGLFEFKVVEYKNILKMGCI